MPEELRRHERMALEVPCRLYIPGQKGLAFQAFATSLNLGLGGIFVQSSFLLQEGFEINLELSLPEGPVSAAARVTHVVPLEDSGAPSGMGIEFLELDSQGRERLLRCLVPPRFQLFHGYLAKEFPHLVKMLPLPEVALVLNLWEEWQGEQRGERPVAPSGDHVTGPRARPAPRRGPASREP